MALPRHLYSPIGPSSNGLFKFFVVLGIVVVLCLLAFVFLGRFANDVSGRTHDIAQAEADAYLKNFSINGVAQCVYSDSDGDGYVSCPYFIKGSDAPHPLECAGSMTINKGCRLPKAVFQPVGGPQQGQ